MSRRGALLGAAAFALAGCSADEMPPGADRGPDLGFARPPETESELRTRIESPDGVVVAGETLNAGLLRRFYARHAYAPVWTGRTDQVRSLADAVLRAPEHGLDPAQFHAALLGREEALPPMERDLVLSGAFLSYADALARGSVPVERRRNDQVLAPEPIDVAAVLDGAAASADPAAAIEALAPTTPTYQALRQALRELRASAAPDRRGVADRMRAIAVNLERQRWLPRHLPADRVWVNVADEQLVMYRADQATFTTRVVVGEDVEKNQSPEFRATIDASFYNPPWVIPADIAAAEILPKLERDPEYLTKNKMVMLANGEVEQLPGPEAGLGLVMFDMPNKFDVYLHDTPERDVFLRENRRISHGCIRVQNPRELAAQLMQQPLGTVDEGIATGNTTRNDLPTPVPVFVVYQTAFVDTDGALQFRPDFYRRDAAIWGKLRGDGVDVGIPEAPRPVVRRAVVAAGRATPAVLRRSAPTGAGRGMLASAKRRALSDPRRRR